MHGLLNILSRLNSTSLHGFKKKNIIFRSIFRCMSSVPTDFIYRTRPQCNTVHIIEIMHFFTYSIQLAVGREIFFYVIFRELDYIFIIVIRGRFLKRKNCIRGLTQKIAKGENEPLLGISVILNRLLIYIQVYSNKSYKRKICILKYIYNIIYENVM